MNFYPFEKRLQVLLLSALAMILLPVLHAVKIVGSDLTGAIIEESLQAFAEEEGIDLETDFSGTYRAKQAISNGLADLAIVAIPNDEAGENLKTFPWVFQVVTIAANNRAPLDELSYNQLAAIFGYRGEYDRWDSLTDEPSWRDRKITLLAHNYSSSIGIEIFKSIVLDKASLNPNIRYIDSVADIERQLIDNNSVIAIYPNLISNELLKPALVRKEDTNEAYSPTKDNVFFGDYPLRLPFHIAFSGKVSDDLKKIVEFLYSDSISKLMESSNYVTIPESEKIAIIEKL